MASNQKEIQALKTNIRDILEDVKMLETRLSNIEQEEENRKVTVDIRFTFNAWDLEDNPTQEECAAAVRMMTPYELYDMLAQNFSFEVISE